jgi:drug/metabolite transporter (DMT)-like permease
MDKRDIFKKTNINNKTSNTLSLLIIFSMIIWGGSWVSAKAIASTLPPEMLTFWRFFINLISFIPVLFFFKEPIKIKKSALIYIFLGSASFGLYLYLFFIGLRHGFAGAGGVLVTTMVPLITFALSIPIFKLRISAKDCAGLILGVAGGSILLKVWTFDRVKILMGGNIYFLICAILWSLLTISSQKAGALVSPLIFSFFVYTFCSIIYLFLALPQGILTIFNQDLSFWLNMLYLSVVSSSFATTVYFIASSRLNSYKASSFIFLVPSSAVFFSWMFLGEKPKISTIIGGLVAIIAVYVINIK